MREDWVQFPVARLNEVKEGDCQAEALAKAGSPTKNVIIYK